MVLLNSLADRKDAFIDSIERILVYSAQVIRACIVEPENKNLGDRSIFLNLLDKQESGYFLYLEAKIIYDSYLYHSLGGNILNAVKPLSNNIAPSINFVCPPSDNLPLFIPSPPLNIDTFEGLLVWASLLLRNSTSNGNGSIDIQLFDANASSAFIQIKLELKLNKLILFGNGNILNSLTTYTNEYNDFDYSMFILNSPDSYNLDLSPQILGGIGANEPLNQSVLLRS